MTALQLVPDRTIRNYQVEVLARAMAEFYSKPLSRIIPGWPVVIQDPDRFVFSITLQPGEILFELFVPQRLADHFKQKAQTVWEKATIKEFNDSVLIINPEKCKCCELVYRRHDIFALATDRDENAPLAEILATTKDMRPGDLVLVDIIFEPTDRVAWEYDAGRAYEKFQKGRMPRKVEMTPAYALGAGFGAFNLAMSEVQKAIVDSIGGENNKTILPMDPERESLAVRGLTPATTKKIHSPALKTCIRIASESPDPEIHLKSFQGHPAIFLFHLVSL